MEVLFVTCNITRDSDSDSARGDREAQRHWKGHDSICGHVCNKIAILNEVVGSDGGGMTCYVGFARTAHWVGRLGQTRQPGVRGTETVWILRQSDRRGRSAQLPKKMTHENALASRFKRSSRLLRKAKVCLNHGFCDRNRALSFPTRG